MQVFSTSLWYVNFSRMEALLVFKNLAFATLLGIYLKERNIEAKIMPLEKIMWIEGTCYLNKKRSN